MSDDFERYDGLDNGKRADFILHSEPIQMCLCIRPSRYLRNAFTHNTYQYDGLTQIITVFDQRNPTKVNETKSLLEMALDCLDIAKATVLTAEILLFLLREEDSACHGVLHPSFYGYCQELCANTTASLMKLVRRRPNRPLACSAWLPVSGPPVVRQGWRSHLRSP